MRRMPHGVAKVRNSNKNQSALACVTARPRSPAHTNHNCSQSLTSTWSHHTPYTVRSSTFPPRTSGFEGEDCNAPHPSHAVTTVIPPRHPVRWPRCSHGVLYNGLTTKPSSHPVNQSLHSQVARPAITGFSVRPVRRLKGLRGPVSQSCSHPSCRGFASQGGDAQAAGERKLTNYKRPTTLPLNLLYAKDYLARGVALSAAPSGARCVGAVSAAARMAGGPGQSPPLLGARGGQSGARGGSPRAGGGDEGEDPRFRREVNAQPPTPAMGGASQPLGGVSSAGSASRGSRRPPRGHRRHGHQRPKALSW